MAATKEKGETRTCFSVYPEILSLQRGEPVTQRLVITVSALLALSACERADHDAAVPAPEVTDTGTQGPHTTSHELSCSDPVRPGDTVASLTSRFGSDAREEALGGPEGSEFAGLALWPDDPSRRLEVFFAEEGPATVSSVRVGDKSQWRVAGLALGDPLAKVREANGAAFTFLGFGWDYGGYVSGFGDGRLGSLPGGCTASLRLDAFAPIDESLEVSGDVEVASDTRGLAEADVRLVELGIGFPGE